MTSEQILGIAQALAEVKPPAAPAPAPAPAFDFADDEYIDGRTLKRMLADRAPARDDTAVILAADANLSIVRSKYARDFERFGHEIDAMLAQVPHGVRTLDNLERVVKMVRSDHLDEIAGELATQRIAGMEPTLRSNGSPASPAPISREFSLESEKIPEAWRRSALANGITERTVDEFCRANDMTPEQFYKQFDKPMSPIVGERGKGSRSNG